MDLDGSQHDVLDHAGHEDLHRGDVLPHPAVVLVLVDLPRGVEHEQPELLDLGVRVGDEALHELLLGQQAAGHLPAEGPLAHHVEGPVAHADRAHGVVDAAAAEAGLGDGERLALAAEQRVERHPHVLVVDEGVAALLLGLAAEAEVAHDLHAGRVGRDQEHRHALVGAHVGVGHHHHDEEAGRLGVRREELPAVDHPLVAVAHGPRGEQGGVGAGLGLGHRVAGEDLAVEQRLEVARLLLVGAVVGDDLGVAGVGRLAAEHDRRPAGPAEDLVDQRQLELAVAGAAEVGAEVAGPQPLVAHPLLQRVDDLSQVVRERRELEARVQDVERLDLLAHELGRSSRAAPGTRAPSRSPTCAVSPSCRQPSWPGGLPAE